MATIVKHFFLYEVGHRIDWMSYDDQVLFIIYGMVWASLIHNVGEEIFGGIVFILPLEGNIIAAQDQQILYNYHKWRGGQCGVGYFVYHVQIFNPPTLQEPKVEESFQELLCWEVTLFVWMIAWGWEIHVGMVYPNLYKTSCLKNTFKQPIIASIGI